MKGQSSRWLSVTLKVYSCITLACFLSILEMAGTGIKARQVVCRTLAEMVWVTFRPWLVLLFLRGKQEW